VKIIQPGWAFFTKQKRQAVMRLMILMMLFFFYNACTSTDNAQSGVALEERELESPDIRLTVQGIDRGLASMVGTFTDQQFKADTTTAKNGVFHFKREKPYEPGLYFVLLPDESIVQMLVDADQTFSIETVKGDLVGSAQVKGSLENELLYRTLKFEESQNAEINRLNTTMRSLQQGTPEHEETKAKRDAVLKERQAYLEEVFNEYPNNLFTKFKMAGQNPEVREIYLEDGTPDKMQQVHYYRKEFWDNVDFSDPRILHTPVIGNKLKRYMTELTPQHPDSIIVASDRLVEKVLDYPTYYKYFVNWIVLKYEPTKTTLMDPEAVFVHMIQNYFTKERAFWTDSVQVHALQLRAHEMAGSLVGNKGPDVKAKNPQGEIKSIYEKDAPYIIVYMFNPQCEHCMVQTPKLVQFYQQWKNQGVDVYAIALDTDDAEWKGYLAKNGMNIFTNVFDPTNRSIYGKYYVDNTPEVYVLNPERIIIGKNLNVDQIPIIINRDKEKRSAG
jgi:peroxiredoxin